MAFKGSTRSRLDYGRDPELVDSAIKNDRMTVADHRAVIKAHYARLDRKIGLMWGTQGMQDMFTKWLLTDTKDRHGNPRRGFPRPVQAALMALSAMHIKLFNTESNPRWDWPADRWE